MDPLTPYLAAVRERVAKATTFHGMKRWWLLLTEHHLAAGDGTENWMLSTDDTDLLEHAPADLARLLALAEAGQKIIESALLVQIYAGNVIHHGTDTVLIESLRGLADATTRYQAIAQED